MKSEGVSPQKKIHGVEFTPVGLSMRTSTKTFKDQVSTSNNKLTKILPKSTRKSIRNLLIQNSEFNDNSQQKNKS